MDRVKELLNNPALGITSSARLWDAVKAHNINVTRANVMKIYKSENEMNQRPAQKKPLQMRIVAPNGGVGALMADLMDVSAYAAQNGGTMFVLHVIDLYSRFLWSFPLRRKTPESIAEHLRSVLETVREKFPKAVISLSTDSGSEFKGDVSSLLTEFDVQHITSLSKNNQSPVERLNRTMWTYFRNFLRATGQTNFISLLQTFVENYNNRVHSSTGKKPVDIFVHKEPPRKVVVDSELVCNGQQCEITDLREKYFSGFRIGDIVRVAKQPADLTSDQWAFVGLNRCMRSYREKEIAFR